MLENLGKYNSVIKFIPLNLMTNVPKLWGKKEIMQEISIINKKSGQIKITTSLTKQCVGMLPHF